MADNHWDGDDWFIALFFTAWFWVPALGALIFGVLALADYLSRLFMRSVGRPVWHFVITAIVPHWFDAVLWLAIVACSVWLVIALVEELTPLVRRLWTQLYWRRRDAAERRRYLATRSRLDDALRDVKRTMNEAQDKD